MELEKIEFWSARKYVDHNCPMQLTLYLILLAFYLFNLFISIWVF